MNRTGTRKCRRGDGVAYDGKAFSDGANVARQTRIFKRAAIVTHTERAGGCVSNNAIIIN
jgi:hypothetical protein